MVKYIEDRWINKQHTLLAIKCKGKWTYYKKDDDVKEKCAICGKVPYDFTLKNIKCPDGVEWRCPDCIGKGKVTVK